MHYVTYIISSNKFCLNQPWDLRIYKPSTEIPLYEGVLKSVSQNKITADLSIKFSLPLVLL